jgi:hypothetical protein
MFTRCVGVIGGWDDCDGTGGVPMGMIGPFSTFRPFDDKHVHLSRFTQIFTYFYAFLHVFILFFSSIFYTNLRDFWLSTPPYPLTYYYTPH